CREVELRRRGDERAESLVAPVRLGEADPALPPRAVDPLVCGDEDPVRRIDDHRTALLRHARRRSVRKVPPGPRIRAAPAFGPLVDMTGEHVRDPALVVGEQRVKRYVVVGALNGDKLVDGGAGFRRDRRLEAARADTEAAPSHARVLPGSAYVTLDD